MSGYGKNVALVTGGAGFIGSRLVRKLAGAGRRVRVLDDFSTGSHANLSGAGDGVEVIEIDLSEDHRPDLFADVDVAYHLAARPSVTESMLCPAGALRNDVQSTANVLDAARLGGVRKVVFTSSCAVYGNGQAGGLRGESLRGYVLPAPTSPYAAAKLCSEVLCQTFGRAFSLGTAVLRLFNVYGPGQSAAGAYAGVIPAFAEAMLAGRQPTIYGDGRQTRDFIYVDDVVDAIVVVGAEPWSSRGSSLANVGSGESTSILSLVGAINDILGTSIEPAFAPERHGDVRSSRADKMLGFYAKTSLRDGLRGVLDAMKGAP